MDTTVREIFGLGTAFILLAALAVVVGNGGSFANILAVTGQSFAGVVNAATAPAR